MLGTGNIFTNIFLLVNFVFAFIVFCICLTFHDLHSLIVAYMALCMMFLLSAVYILKRSINSFVKLVYDSAELTKNTLDMTNNFIIKMERAFNDLLQTAKKIKV